MSPAAKSSEFFSNVDAAWLHMEKPANMAMITGVMIFDQPIEYTRLRQTVEERLLRFNRFTQRVREPLLGVGLPRWETDPDFDLDWHLQKISLPAPGDMPALQQLVSEMMGIQLDFSRPLWQYHFVENFNQGCALICRIHHCIADGLALVQVLLTMTDETADSPPKPTEVNEHKIGRLARLMIPAVRAVKTLESTRQVTENLLHEGMQTLIHPGRALDVAQLGAKGTRALGKLLLIGPDRKTIFKGKCSTDKQAAWSSTLRLEEVKEVGKLMGGTVNDVLLSAVTGALRRYLEGRGEPVEGVNIRAVVPVSLRPDEDLHKLGNRFGLVFLSLPIGVRDPLKRMIVLKRRMDAIKNTPEAVVAFGILNAIGMTPVQIETIIVSIFGMKGTAVMTNVPGPRQVIYLAGKPLRSLMFWVPQPGNLGMGVSIISYAGEVILGVATDACLVPDPENIIKEFQNEFETLRNWGRYPASRENIASSDSAYNQCQAKTKSGNRCKNRALPGQPTCHVHQDLIRPTPGQ
jgi:diacylglycerol O-acyltransferase